MAKSLGAVSGSVGNLAERMTAIARLSLLGALAATVTFAVAACTSSIGPRTLARDRFDYSSTVADSWKQQTLLNIVKLRYLDLPVFLDVGQIVSGYTLESTGTLGASMASGGTLTGDTGSVGGSVRYTDRPTITYTPLTGDKFLRGMLTPIQPASVFFLLQSGYAADFVMAMGVETLSGLRNPTSARLGGHSPSGREFARAIDLLRDIQLQGALLFRVESKPGQEEHSVVFFRDENVPAEVTAKIAELRDLLRLQPQGKSFKLLYSPLPGGPGELAIQTRSMLQILGALAATVEVPSEDIERGRAIPSPLAAVGGDAEEMPFLVRSADNAPDGAYAAVRYRDRWFWIDDSDLRSKRAFGFVMFLFTLTSAGGTEQLPVLTIPTG